jgi:DNA (cytosine-5)-methyltransferase 1
MSSVRSQVSKVDYIATLEEAWRQHLMPRAEDAPTVISTFAGAGGSSLGYSMAGYRELLAVEWDDNAVETFKLNFADVPVYHGDIAKLSVEECMRLAGLTGLRQLDVLDGSPPCQGFSTAGKRKFDDDRNQLFREYVRLLRGLQPKVFVMENVSGMVKGKMKLIFADILRELKASGYRVSARLLNAMYFYVPQSRQRMIFVGVREDLAIEPSHPGAQNRPITVRESIESADNKTFNRPLATIASAIWKRAKPGENGSCYRSGYYRDAVKLHPDKPAPTIPKVLPGTGGQMRWDIPRTLTMEELKRLGSFPDAYQMQGAFVDQWARIGNSVPPLFMRSIAEHIRTNILDVADNTGQTPVRVE